MTPNTENKEDLFPPVWLLIVMSLLTVLLLVFLGRTLYAFKMKTEVYEPVDPPTLVLNFLNEITAEDANTEEVLSKYLLTNNLIESNNVSPLRSKLAFDYILHPGGDKSYGYKVIYSDLNYLEFALLDENGNETYPLIAFGYQLNEFKNRIEDYSLARLQPFSRRNPEYDKRWSK